MQLRLPTEAEWENACRAGIETAFHFGSDIALDQVNFRGTWNDYDSWSEVALQQTAAVKSYPPNAWGLYEMHGNIWEWCQDYYDDYPSDPITDPEEGSKNDYYSYHRVLRGGSWFSSGVECRSASRDHDRSTNRFDVSGGFRLTRGHELKPVRVLGRVQ